jgi:diguanylate cyclase (GGDEF) domain
MVDVTLRRLAELRLERLANTDELTGLPNRRHFLETVRKELARSARFGKPLCMAMIDIDDFKKVNDTHGHGVGDLALQHVAAAIARERRAFDVSGGSAAKSFAFCFRKRGWMREQWRRSEWSRGWPKRSSSMKI